MAAGAMYLLSRERQLVNFKPAIDAALRRICAGA
jgi:hypothetical protein